MNHRYRLAFVATILLSTLASCKSEPPTARLRDADVPPATVCTDTERNDLSARLSEATSQLDRAAAPIAAAEAAEIVALANRDAATRDALASGTRGASGDVPPPDEVVALRLNEGSSVPSLVPERGRVLTELERFVACVPLDASTTTSEPETTSVAASEQDLVLSTGDGLGLADPKAPPPSGGVKPGNTGGAPGLGGVTKPGTSGMSGLGGTKPGTTPGLGTKPGTTPGLGGAKDNDGAGPTPGGTGTKPASGLGTKPPSSTSGLGTKPATNGATPGLGGKTPPAPPYHQVFAKLTTQYKEGNSGTGTTVPVGSLAFKPLPAKAPKADFDAATAHLFGTDTKAQAEAHTFYQFGRDGSKPGVLGRQADIEASDPKFDKFTALVGNNKEAPAGWNPAKNMVYLQGLLHRGEPIFMASDPGLDATQLGAKPDGSMRPSVTAHEITELKKAGWTYEAFSGGPKDGLHGKWLPPKE